jgi:Cys-rich protein (TIGR01571 family)|eukprot:COSAG01_NODE_4446_length_5014_cov_27.756867_7_plen_357_part_00
MRSRITMPAFLVLGCAHLALAGSDFCGEHQESCACLEDKGDGGGLKPDDDCCALPRSAACLDGYVMTQGLGTDSPCWEGKGPDGDHMKAYSTCCTPIVSLNGTVLSTPSTTKAKLDKCNDDRQRRGMIARLIALVLFGGWSLTWGIGVFVACIVCAPKQNFQTKIHSCGADWDICLVTAMCPCITWSKIAAYTGAFAVSNGNTYGTHTEPPLNWPLCCTYFWCNNLACCFGMMSRDGLRKKHRIQGDWGGDCMIHTFAHPCALCQEMAEIRLGPRDGHDATPRLMNGHAAAPGVPIVTAVVVPPMAVGVAVTPVQTMAPPNAFKAVTTLHNPVLPANGGVMAPLIAPPLSASEPSL